MNKRSVLDMYYGPKRAKQTEKWYTSKDSQSFSAFVSKAAMDVPFKDGVHLAIKAAYTEGLMQGFQDAVASMPISSIEQEVHGKINEECDCIDCVWEKDRRAQERALEE